MPDLRFLITAGNTRERIDAVRDWGNIFTGNTGFDIALALADYGTVDLLTSNRNHLAAISAGLDTKHPIQASGFASHAELRGALDAMLNRQKYHAIFMTAAVADYRPVRSYSVLERKPADGGEGGGEDSSEEIWRVRDVQAGKVKSHHKEIAILGQQTEKLVDLFRSQWKHTGLLFKFKLEVDITRDELIRVGQSSRAASGAEYLIANSLEMVQGEKPGAFLLSDSGQEWIERSALAKRLAQLAAK